MSIPLNNVGPGRYEIPKSFDSRMRVPGMIYTNEKLLEDILKDKAVDQVVNVASLPGIIGYSMAMPDVHWGYGFPIGGVAATDIQAGGVISPGGVGFDINCGVRLARTDFHADEIKNSIRDLIKALFQNVPSGVGSEGGVKLSPADEKLVLLQGSRWAVAQGFGTEADLEATEDQGSIPGAIHECLSERAFERGKKQLGTLGSGNHFLEVQVIDQIFDEKAAEELHLFKGQVTVMIHCGSRGLGYQVCEDYARGIIKALEKYHISVPDRQLACAPVESPEGQEYLGAIRAAANFAFANRQHILHLTRRSFAQVFHKSWEQMGINLVYDVAHNIAKIEKHRYNGRDYNLCVHRKGATRSFPPGHPDLPERYRRIGQPVIIPGDMGRHSFLMLGSEGSAETFYSCCHGAGRVMSRTKAKAQFSSRQLVRDLEEKGIVLQAHSMATITEEAPGVYKDVSQVVDVVEKAGLAKKVCRMRPLGVVKG